MTEELSDRIDDLATAAYDMAHRLGRGVSDIRACEAARKVAAEALQWIIDYGAPAEIEAKAREALKSVDLGRDE